MGKDSVAVTIGQRMQRRRQAMGITQEDVAAALDVSYQTVSGWERGASLTPSKYLPQLARLLDMTIDELLLGDEMLPPGAYPVTDMVALPVIGQAQAGEPRLPMQDYEETKPVEKELIRGGEYFWMRVEGDSMVGAGIFEGGLVLVRRQPYVENGQIGVVDLFDDGVMIKHVHRTNNSLVLISANARYVPIYARPEACRVIGLVEEYRKRTI